MSVNLSTRYLGLTLKNPIVAGASPLTKNVASIQKLDEAQVGAIVVSSLFEEQIEMESQQLDHFLTYGTQSFGEALSYLPEKQNYHVDAQEHLEIIEKAKKMISVPLIASLNGMSDGGWTEYARRMEDAGADALELNVYFLPTNPDVPGVVIEQKYLDILKSVKAKVRIPVSIKIGPYFSSIAHMSKRLVEAGADGLVFFNRFYQPDIDLEKLEVVPNVVLSRPYAFRTPLRWVAVLYGRLQTDFAITSGVHTHEDVLKAMMAGAQVVEIAAEFLQQGMGRVKEMLTGMTKWMEENEYVSIAQMLGSMSQKNAPDPMAFERSQYMKALQSYNADPTGRLT